MFSATMKKKVEHFAREIIRNPVRVVIGSIGHANPDIQQVHLSRISRPPLWDLIT
jgi:superfamily II DNA/RNA helicase